MESGLPRSFVPVIERASFEVIALGVIVLVVQFTMSRVRIGIKMRDRVYSMIATGLLIFTDFHTSRNKRAEPCIL